MRFVIAYDKNIFGDLRELFKKSYLGCETNVDYEERFKHYYLDDENDKKEFEIKVKEKENQGMEILYLSLDQDYGVVINMLKNINERLGGNKIEFIYDGSDN